MIDHNLETVQVPVGELKTYPGNARRGDLPAIKKSIEMNGFYTSLTVQRSTGYIIAGNHRYMAAKELGVEEVPVQYLDVDDKKARAIALVDNKTADDAEMDVHALIALLEGVDSDDDWESTGYGPEDLAELLDEANDQDLESLPDVGVGGSLVAKFGAPPFTVLDTRAGYWQDRRRGWTNLGIESELGRDGGLLFDTAVSLYQNWYEVKALADKEAGRKLPEREVIEGPHAGRLVKFKDGKSTTSIFDPALCELLYRWHTLPGDIVLDPWAGGSVRGVVAGSTGRHYRGIELRPEQVEANRAQAVLVHGAATAEEKVEPEWVAGESTEQLGKDDGAYDFVIGCPPYYNLEVYSDDPRDLSTMKPAAFDEAMHKNIAAAAALLKVDRFAAVVVGAVRDKKGNILDMRKLMIEAFGAAGMNFVNDAILVNNAGSAALRAARQFNSTRVLARVHQEVLIFCKGDRKKAAKRLGSLDLQASIDAAELMAADLTDDEDEDA